MAYRSCNGFKSVRSSYIDPESGQEARFYHPRQDRWIEHFVVSSELCEIMALTAICRATTISLKMNNQAQLTARQFWVQLGLFP